MGAIGYQWVPLDAVGWHWVLLGAIGYRWVLLGAVRYHWVPSGTNGCHWVLMGAVGCHWVPAGPLTPLCPQDAEGVPIDIKVKDNGDGTYHCVYVPTKAIKHTIIVTWAGVTTPRSPFRVGARGGQGVLGMKMGGAMGGLWGAGVGLGVPMGC